VVRVQGSRSWQLWDFDVAEVVMHMTQRAPGACGCYVLGSTADVGFELQGWLATMSTLW
jgi:hypothetical protein